MDPDIMEKIMRGIITPENRLGLEPFCFICVSFEYFD